MMNEQDQVPYLTGSLLVAMPSMGDPRFERSVIYMCAHNADGAMGLVINRELDSITFDDLLSQLGVTNAADADLPILFGGPVETGRGFVLHSRDYDREGSLDVGDDVALTATIDILKAIAEGEGPHQCLLALGYAGWSAGQLEQEIQANGWLTVEADKEIVFETALEERWARALSKIGIDASRLTSFSGSA